MFANHFYQMSNFLSVLKNIVWVLGSSPSHFGSGGFAWILSLLTTYQYILTFYLSFHWKNKKAVGGGEKDKNEKRSISLLLGGSTDCSSAPGVFRHDHSLLFSCASLACLHRVPGTWSSFITLFAWISITALRISSFVPCLWHFCLFLHRQSPLLCLPGTTSWFSQKQVLQCLLWNYSKKDPKCPHKVKLDQEYLSYLLR